MHALFTIITTSPFAWFFGAGVVSYFLPQETSDFLWKLLAWWGYPVTPGVVVLGLLLKLLGIISFPVIWVLMIPIMYFAIAATLMAMGVFAGGILGNLIESFDKPSR